MNIVMQVIESFLVLTFAYNSLAAFPRLDDNNYPNPTECIAECDELHIVIAILISKEANEKDLNAVKAFILNSVSPCLQQREGRMAINIIDPGMSGFRPWCQDIYCVKKILEEISLATCAVAIESFSRNDTQTIMAAKIGRSALKPDIMFENRVPELMIITNYISAPFARMYDYSLNLRTNLSHVHFRIAIIGAPIEYYQQNSSLSNDDMYFYEEFSDLDYRDARLCYGDTIVFRSALGTVVCVAVVFIFIQSTVFFAVLLYKKKRRYDSRRRRIDELEGDICRSCGSIVHESTISQVPSTVRSQTDEPQLAQSEVTILFANGKSLRVS